MRRRSWRPWVMPKPLRKGATWRLGSGRRPRGAAVSGGARHVARQVGEGAAEPSSQERGRGGARQQAGADRLGGARPWPQLRGGASCGLGGGPEGSRRRRPSTSAGGGEQDRR